MSKSPANDTPASLGIATAEEWDELAFIEQASKEHAREAINQRTMSDPPTLVSKCWLCHDNGCLLCQPWASV